MSKTATELKEKGNKFLQAGKIKEAMQCYQESIAQDSSYEASYANLGMALAMSGDLEGGEKIYLKGLENCSVKHSILFNLGVLYTRNAEYEKAVDTFKKYLLIVPEPDRQKYASMGAVYLSVAYLRLEDFSNACETLQLALELDTELDVNGFDMLVDAVEDILDEQNDPFLSCIAGTIDIINANLETAEDHFREAISQNDELAAGFLGLGIVLGAPQDGDSAFSNKTSKRLNTAVQTLMKAIELNPDSIAAHYYTGMISLGLLDLEAPFRAQASFKKVIELGNKKNIVNEQTKQADNLLKTDSRMKVLNK